MRATVILALILAGCGGGGGTAPGSEPVPPETFLLSTPEQVMTEATAIFEFESDKPGVTYRVWLDDVELEEVAKELNIPPNKLFKDLSYWGKELSLDDTVGIDDEGQPLIDRVSSDEFLPPNSELIKESLEFEIKQALDSLNADEAEVLRLYYGIGRERQLTLLEIGNMMNLSRERIRQIKNKALRKLRYIHRREKLQPYLE